MNVALPFRRTEARGVPDVRGARVLREGEGLEEPAEPLEELPGELEGDEGH
ncbi:hypothetical protein ACIQ7D_15040 [Streptomyces sp. NPDC096310]|uniref:hypothetical protein n=1 Tax=Streptomyces sp. NPDC096310 TaxID=3366082 RepID=UPI0037FC692E